MPGPVLGPGNPLMNETGKAAGLQGAGNEETEAQGVTVYLLDTPHPQPQPQDPCRGAGTCPCPHLQPDMEASRCEESSAAPGSSTGSASDKLRETEARFPQLCHGEGGGVRWYLCSMLRPLLPL